MIQRETVGNTGHDVRILRHPNGSPEGEPTTAVGPIASLKLLPGAWPPPTAKSINITLVAQLLNSPSAVCKPFERRA